MRKTIFIISGFITLALGTLGIFLPVLPTTPFYLLTAWLFLHSSDALYRRAMNNRFFGSVVRNYVENKSISKRVKTLSISTTWLTILLSIALIDVLWVRILLLCVAVGVSIHILAMKTLPDKDE